MIFFLLNLIHIPFLAIMLLVIRRYNKKLRTIVLIQNICMVYCILSVYILLFCGSFLTSDLLYDEKWEYILKCVVAKF